MKAGQLVRERMMPHPLERARAAAGAEVWGIVWRRVRMPVRVGVGHQVAADVAEQVNTGQPPAPKAGTFVGSELEATGKRSAYGVRDYVDQGVLTVALWEELSIRPYRGVGQVAVPLDAAIQRSAHRSTR